MRIQWKKEWTTPALVGVGSFAAGVGVGVLGYRTKLNREIAKNFQDMEEGVFDPDVYTFKGDDIPIYDDVRKRVGIVNSFEVVDQGIVVEGTIHDDSTIRILKDLDVVDEEKVEKEITSEAVEACQIEDVNNELMKQFVDGVNRDIEYAEKEASGEHPVIQNVFDSDIDWDQEAEEANRTTDAPYILHEDEYFENQKGYHQSSITYYEGDEILADEHDVPIYNFEEQTGPLLFGKGSKDPDTVYIRNDKTKGEWEITRNPSHYQIEIMGLHAEQEAEDDELRHSQKILRFRME